MSGRTEWLPKDAGWHRRGRVVELGQRHGGAAVNAMDWMLCEARTQNPIRGGKGEIKTGYAAIAHGAFLESVEQAREIVLACVEIRLLDDFDEEVDHRTFRARISGWRSDVNLTLEAARKAAERAGTSGDNMGRPDSATSEQGEDGDNLAPGAKGAGGPPGENHGNTGDFGPDNLGQPRTNPANVPGCPKSSPTQHNKTLKEEANASSLELAKASTDSLRLSRLLAELIVQREPRAKVRPESDAWLRPMRLLLADREQDAAEVEKVLRWSQASDFWQGIILSPTKLRAQFTALTLKMRAAPIRLAGDAQRATKPSRPDSPELERLITSLFPGADRGRASQAVLAAWGMGHRDAGSIRAWAAETDPGLVEGMAA